jgi:hypothetical protein
MKNKIKSKFIKFNEIITIDFFELKQEAVFKR